MRIPLDLSQQKDRVSVIATVLVAGHFIPIKFVVDTGSPVTFIDEFDAKKFRIFTKNLKLDNHLLMAGTKIALYKIGKAVIYFKDESSNLQKMEFDELKVSQSAWSRAGTTYTGTSILGMDFLNENELHLFVDSKNNIAYIGKG